MNRNEFFRWAKKAGGLTNTCRSAICSTAPNRQVWKSIIMVIITRWWLVIIIIIITISVIIFTMIQKRAIVIIAQLLANCLGGRKRNRSRLMHDHLSSSSSSSWSWPSSSSSSSSIKASEMLVAPRISEYFLKSLKF